MLYFKYIFLMILLSGQGLMRKDEGIHERLADRLASMLTKLNMGQHLDVRMLSEEFNVSARTILRDFDRLGASIPLLKDEHNKKYYLHENYLGKVTAKDIVKFAEISGIRDLYPSLDMSFLRELLNSRADQIYTTQAYSVEDASQFTEIFKVVGNAIRVHKQIEFLYKGVRKCVQPYRLIHHHGNWYLAAVFEKKLKAFRLSRIELLEHQADDDTFIVDPAILSQLEAEETIWFGQEKIEIILTVRADVAEHFQARSLLPEQKIIKLMEDGGLLLSSQITHTTQIFPLVRYWIPHLKIISPERLQDEMEQEVKKYFGI